MQREYTPRRLQVYDEPTMFNKEMAIGALMGFGPLGMIVGGLIGKSRMRSEKLNGKMVGEPSAWNKDTILGGLLGSIAGVAILAVTMTTGVGVAAVAASIGGMLLGGYIGGQHGKGVQEAEYYKAIDQEQYFARQASGHSPSLAPDVPCQEQTTYRDMVRDSQQNCEHHR